MFCRPFPRATVAWLACASLVAPLLAAEMRSSGSAGDFSLRRWTTEDGLPMNTVKSLLQTHDGYLWVGTKHGLARFDGVRFKVFTEELAMKEGDDLSCFDLMEDTVGRLWVHLPAGLVCYHQGRFHKFSLRSEPLQATIATAIASREGGLWIGTQGEGLKRFEDGRYTREYRTTNGLADNSIGGLREDRVGRLWGRLRRSCERLLAAPGSAQRRVQGAGRGGGTVNSRRGGTAQRWGRAAVARDARRVALLGPGEAEPLCQRGRMEKGKRDGPDDQCRARCLVVCAAIHGKAGAFPAWALRAVRRRGWFGGYRFPCPLVGPRRQSVGGHGHRRAATDSTPQPRLLADDE